MAMNGIKMEVEPQIKQDPESFTPGGFMDDDLYEDTGELNMPPKHTADIWLTRVPKWLWESLATAGDDEEIEVGKIAMWDDPHGNSGKQEMKLILNQEWQSVQNLPREYSIKATNLKPDNTFVFTEKDLPGYKPNAYGRSRADHGAVTTGQDPRSGSYRVQKQKGRVKKAIPSTLIPFPFHPVIILTFARTEHTTLIGPAKREFGCIPVPNAEFKQFMDKRTQKAIQGENATTIIAEGKVDHTNIDKAQNAFRGFIRTGAAPKVRQENKAARIPKNELIDMLHKLFDEFEYWPMREIKQRTRQPEAYLKETLSDIADLVKSGSFASCWKRHAEYNKTSYTVHGKPPEADGEPDDDQGLDEEDDNLEMEDVV
ncbi:hypothetical protein AOQ84DRAFT_443790 [Glonium stellatum]|uniref:Transcription initiation factor IIF subunit beta n=1 Tax=Glonium stellatum TaxID=574774 RepID=A0A8E2JLU1_9PEZI|nr:hypothetical protein AOQ84DRAFT_443790 [Glonium stellatum]